MLRLLLDVADVPLGQPSAPCDLRAGQPELVAALSHPPAEFARILRDLHIASVRRPGGEPAGQKRTHRRAESPCVRRPLTLPVSRRHAEA